jgi:hypothetical protein
MPVGAGLRRILLIKAKGSWLVLQWPPYAGRKRQNDERGGKEAGSGGTRREAPPFVVRRR